MIHSFVARIARSALPLAIASATGMAAAQTLTYSNSPGGYPGNVSYAGGTASLQTGTPIDLMGPEPSPPLFFRGNNFNFSFQTGATADGWTFAPGGTVSMVVADGAYGGIDVDNDFHADILAGTTVFTGVLGATTVRDRSGIECNPRCIGSDFDISASFTVSALHSGYAAALGVPTGSYTGSFLLGVSSWDGGSATARVGWREVTLNLNQQTAPVPEPETYAMMLAGLGLVGLAARRRRQESAA